MWAEPALVRYVGIAPSTPEESWSRLLRYVGHWSLLGYGFWAVEELATGRFVGDVGIAEFRRTRIVPPLERPEAGWMLAPWAHGQGYATEAVRAILAWSDARGGALARTTCIINPENAASIRVATKCGFVEERRVDYAGKPVVVFRR
jgi:RimJ/RimL family protein N-acetyltransferase